MAALIRHGIAVRALARERVCGDAGLVQPFGDGVLLAVVDGLGHGESAAQAARIALDTLAKYSAESLSDLLLHCHRCLKGTRGAVMSMALINREHTAMGWLGVGNVEGLLVRSSHEHSRHERLLTRGGVLGYQLPPLRHVTLPVAAGDLLIFATDGIHGDFTAAPMFADPLLRNRSTQGIADRIMADYARVSDDALVLVARLGALADE